MNHLAEQFVGANCRTGTVLIITMWVILVLAGLALVFANSMRVQAAVTANNRAAIEAECIAAGAVQYIMANLTASKEDNETATLEAETETPYDAVKVGDGYFWVLRANLENDRDYEFGLTHEAGKINLNTAGASMLLMLPGMTEQLAASIVDWRDADSDVTTNGAEDDYYLLLSDPYNAKNANLETVEEILLIQGGTEDLLYGEDTNLNGILDENENDGDESDPPDDRDGQLDRGFYDYVTVYSAESSLDSEGTARIDVNDMTNSRTNLQTLLEDTFGSDRATTVLSAVGSANSTSLIAFFYTSGLTLDEFNQIADHLTTCGDVNTPGLINVNVASKPVLMCFTATEFGLAETDIDSLIAYREGNNDLSSIAWVTQVLDQTKATAVGPYITVHSYQCAADIVAVSGDGRAFRRYRVIIDVSGTKPRITYWKNMTKFGWPLPETIVTALRKGQPLTNDVLGY